LKGAELKSQVILLEHLLLDAGDALGFSAKRDIETLWWRYDQEGLPFLTITLPRLDDLLIAGLRDGQLPPYEGWLSRCAFPEFLSGIWKLIFSRDGQLLSNPSIPAIRWLRQISRLHKKIFEVCEADRVAAEIDQFVTTDKSLLSRADTRATIDPYARKVAQILFGRLIGEAMETIDDGRHGPGAVSESLGVNERWSFDSISYNIESLVGPEYFRSSWIDLLERPPSNQEVPARLEAVPKTALKPRLISIEPSYNQFVQQALQLRLKALLERDAYACSYTYQHHNQRMALQGSIDDLVATIDLSEASDRVSLALVDELFGFNPSFVRYLKLSRSRFVQLPDGELVLLNKFASMGSALTFPIESMVFHTLVATAICRSRGSFSDRSIRSLRRRSHTLSVYGDDIIIPVDVYPHVVESLTSLGMKVNESKSFHTGKFRESCGVDAFDGRVVTPAYARAYLPQSRANSNELVKASSLRNQLYERFGFIRTVRFLDSLIGNLVKYPSIPHGMSGIGRWSDSPDLSFCRWNPTLFRREWHLPTLVEVKRRDPIDSYTALNKSLRTSLNEDPDHLVFAGRPVATEIHYRWCAEV
jgi:hypothetical protein